MPSPAFTRPGRRADTSAPSGPPASPKPDRERRRTAGRPAARAAASASPSSLAGTVRTRLAGLRPATSSGWTRAREAAAPVLAGVRRRLAPMLSMVSPLGWIVALGAVVLGAIGLVRGWLEFTTLALMLVLLLGAAIAFTLGRWEYEATISLGNKRVRVGELALGRVEVRNASGRASASTRIELPVGRNIAPFRVPRLGAGDAHEEVFQVPARRRGVITIGPVRSVRSDPVGLLSRQRSWTDPVELFVHPDTVLLDTRAVGFLKDIEGVTTQNLSSSDVSFHALRDYVPGDDRRAIHWRTTARVGRLMVRQFEETMRSHLLIVLSLNPADYADADDFELAVSVVGSLGTAALREERQLSVYTSDGVLAFPSAMGLLDELCRLQARPNAPSLRELAGDASRRVPGASVVAIVVGGVVEPAALRSAHLMLPPEATTFALRCGRALTATRRKASNLLVLDIGQLADLQRGMRTLT